MTLIAYMPVIIQGIAMTLAAWVSAASISVVIGMVLGIAGCEQLSTKKRSWLIFAYTFVAKGIPAYVQILIAYFVIPGVLGFNIPAFVAAVGALAFCSSGYVTEIIRSAVNAVSRGQWDACFVLGYSRSATLRRVIMPQALKIALPALCGELEQLLKSSSLLATIGITELTRTGMNIISRELNPIPVYCMVAGIYLILSAGLLVVRKAIERGGSYDNSN